MSQPAATLEQRPAQADRLDQWRDELRRSRETLRVGFVAKPDTPRLLRSHAQLVDRVVRDVWTQSAMPRGIALIAVGGYGRGQLYPHSDVDVMVLLPDALDALPDASIERLLAKLWDVGLELGHAVRTIADCVTEMNADVTVRTSLLEHRLIAGSRALYARFAQRFTETLDVRAFYEAKTLEQQQRHFKYHDAAYNLEPNVKESPGGLRDLQTVIWIARAAGLGRTWMDLAARGLMTTSEARAVSRQERLIGEIRARLHFLAQRREDRLVFDLQSVLAAQLGLVDTPTKRASEQLMQRYYRAAKLTRQVNTILLQNLHARLFPIDREPIPLDDDFVAIDELLHIRDERLFERRPGAMLESFLQMQRHPELKGMSARTLRALWRNRNRIDAKFRRDPANRATFMRIVREPRGITHELRRMNLYDVLGHYLPAFGRVVGQMQHDLFHVYTVDEHILMLIRNLRRFTEAQHAHEYPLCSRLIADFDRREVLYLAGLFHDIAKGRGGDHSTLGARDAKRFCRDHGLAAEDVDLVGWLVERHLTMSMVAQKQDISDPAVVASFASAVVSERRLIALYLLTVADIRATSPRVWNAWKAQLLEDLFNATRRLLAGTDTLRSIQDGITERQSEARRLLRLYAVPQDAESALWRHLDTAYFQRLNADEIAWHARHLYWRIDRTQPVVKARLSRAGAGLQVLVYLPDQKELFARICGFIGRMGLSILEAKVHTTRHGFALDSFMLHDPSNPNAAYRSAIQYIEHELCRVLEQQTPLTQPERGRVSRRLRHFPLTPQVQIFADDKGTHFILEIVAGDRPGLLASVAYVLAKANINVVSAKINTLGERAEDVFLIDGARLHDEQAVLKVETALVEVLRI
ncbi:MAG TPA: [protein-PII] uridylyltransferase [Casimicrobiaceae bacterium]|nr:[protein-PII] uridylyltransferase [Casimicrobiaceae bacterium]